MKVFNPTFLKFYILLFIVISSSFCKLFAQSSIEVNATKNKTSVSVSNFPKNSEVLIIDEDFNLLSVMTTNTEGSATININKVINKNITARTIHGDFEATYKVKVITSNQDKVAVSQMDKTIKA